MIPPFFLGINCRSWTGNSAWIKLTLTSDAWTRWVQFLKVLTFVSKKMQTLSAKIKSFTKVIAATCATIQCLKHSRRSDNTQVAGQIRRGGDYASEILGVSTLLDPETCLTTTHTLKMRRHEWWLQKQVKNRKKAPGLRPVLSGASCARMLPKQRGMLVAAVALNQ